MRAPIDHKPMPPRCPIPTQPPTPAPGKKGPSFDELDANGDGKLQYDEYVTRGTKYNAMFALRQRSEEFKQMDANHDGEVSRFEHFVHEFREGHESIPKPPFDWKDASGPISQPVSITREQLGKLPLIGKLFGG